ncbi:MAG: ROK family protein [Candidatus Brocadiaceae bacterium]|nr:ROK family protein [Candidatus Brocadiaceae bacterium]
MKGFILAADVGGTNMRTALLNVEGEVLKSLKRPSLAHKGREALIKRLVQMFQDTLREGGADIRKIRGIGVGFPGPLDTERGIVFNPPNLKGWQEVYLRDILEQEMGRPVALENDANAAALGEYWKGAGRGTRSLVCLTLGTGVGGGVVLEGRVWHGAKGIAGEIGHMTLVKNGRRCGCGNRGCLETYGSATGIITTMKGLLERHHIKPKEAVTLERMGKWARAGDSLAQRAIKETGLSLGIGIANVANLLNPEMIVLSGGVTNLGGYLFGPLREEVKKRALPKAVEGLRIVRAELGDSAGVIGAARALLLTVAQGRNG